MGYFIRFLTQSTNPVDLVAIYNALAAKDVRYKIAQDESGRSPGNPASFKDKSWGLLIHSGKVYGSITICPRGSELFREDMTLLESNTARTNAENRQKILDFLKKTNCMVALQIMREGWDDLEDGKITGPLFDWLLETYGGLVHAQNEGYYDKDDNFILNTSDCEMNYIDAVFELGITSWSRVKNLESYIRRVYPEYAFEVSKDKAGNKMKVIWKGEQILIVEGHKTLLKCFLNLQIPYVPDEDNSKMIEHAQRGKELGDVVLKYLK
jgi:hypothetical protein